ncbi:MAG TPA: hypothetical protein VFZ53_31000 [Polyangiaceae bacterium]
MTFSPLHLLFPAVEVQAEYKLIDHLGLSLIGGYGWPTEPIEDEDGVEENVRFDVIEVGTQVMWYPLRKFRSLQVGGELMYIHVSTQEPVGDENATGLASGVAVGPLVGYKFIVGPGFTGFVQGGVQFVVLHAEASDDTGATDSEDASAVGVNLNLNLGWSF